MRFLLINPPTPLSERPNPPLGLAFIAAALEEAGVEVKLVDLVTHPCRGERLAALLDEFQPQLVGMTAVTMTFNLAREVLREVKAVNPDILTVMGGPHVTFSAQETLKSVPELDLIVMGEGEKSVVELTAAAANGRDWGNVRGIAYRDGERVNVTPGHDPIDVNTLPLPARHLLPLGRYRALKMPISITTSRGCPFPCIFCSARDMAGAKIRYRDPEAVVDELEELAGLGFHQINIADDLFTAKKKHCLAICDAIVARGLTIAWSCFSRVDTISPEMLRRMKEAGCATMAFGIESANEQILKTVRKGITIPKTVEAVRMCVDAGIDPHCSFILGLPGETPETLAETLGFCERIQGMGASYGLHLLAPFPGTALRKQHEADAFDLKILTDDWSQYHANRAIVETSSVSAAELNAIVDDWTRKVEQRMEEARATGGSEHARKEREAIENLVRILFYHELMMSDAIEAEGTWEHPNPAAANGDALQLLAQRIQRLTKTGPEEALRILQHAFDHGHIIRADDAAHVRWAWNDRLVSRPAHADRHARTMSHPVKATAAVLSAPA
jgi:anaerobic magnesium-protoporphyrin IX monomethyl ester cyclase